MVCDCCRRKKRIFESFAAVKGKNYQLNFCVDCNDLAYKVRDAAGERDKDGYHLYLTQWRMRAKKPSKNFIEWQKCFLTPLEGQLQSSDN